jgi:two-component system, chemotaxis family, sensor kinase CheA
VSMRDLSASLQALFLEELDERLRDFDADLEKLEATADETERVAIVNRLFRGAHSLKGAASTVGAASIESVCHQLEDFLGELRDGRVIFIAGHADVLLETTAALRAAGRDLAKGKPGVPIVADLAERLASPAAPPPAPPPPQRPPPASEAPTAAVLPPLRDRTLRVASEKIDALLQQSGELISARMRSDMLRSEIATAADLAHRIRRGTPDADALGALERTLDHIAASADLDRVALESTTNELDAGLRELRMVPFASVCEGLDRIVAEAAASGKSIAFEIDGGEIGLDRTIVDRVRDPLVHLVRNAVDHGIEIPQRRIDAGKPARGTIRLSAAVHGGHVQVIVSDDGRGMDDAELRKRARERGVDVAGVDAAVLAFLPGISTATVVTGRSGRGVGLDAVRSEIEAVRGTVSVSSTPNRGTRFTLLLPFTLMTLRVILFHADGQALAINAGWVQRFVRIEPHRVQNVGGRSLLHVGDETIPLVSLGEVLNGPAQRPEPRAAIVVDALGSSLAFAVDELLEERDLVFRSLGARLSGVRHVSGAAILGDGSIALILRGTALATDALALARRARPTRVAAPEAGAPKRVLLVDDSVTTRALERSILEAAGYDVVTAPDGQAAWQILSGDEDVDVVVSDVDMPHMDGFTLAETIRRSNRRRELPVILVTARDNDADRQRGLQAGADAYIVKSGFRQETLLDAIAELV